MEINLHHPETTFVTCHQLPAVDWQPGAACLFTDGLAVFRLAVPPVAGVASRLEARLSPDEIIRANRYHRVIDRLRFVAGRGLLRILIGKYSHQPPDRVQIDSRAGRKPTLLNAPGVEVSVSHAGNWVLVAVGRDEPVGVDVEFMDDSVDYPAIVRTSFSPAEQHAIAVAHTPRPLFYEFWTRKEALVKAADLGITDNFCHIPARPGNHRVAGYGLGAGAWVVAGFAVDPAHPAAVAHRPGVGGPVFYTIHTDILP